MTKHPSGTILWVHEDEDPHDVAGKRRPVIIVRHKHRPYNSTECTVMCLGHGSRKENHRTPKLESGVHYTGITFGKDTYLLPWSIHTIPPGALNDKGQVGQLTHDGRKLVAREFARMF